MKEVLFVCVENSGRSQMAEVFVRLNGEGKMEASSAGTMPVKEVNPMDIQVMRERGMDLSAKKPKLITNQMVQEANMNNREGCSAQWILPGPMQYRV